MLSAVLAVTLAFVAAQDDAKEKAKKLVNRGNQSFALGDFEAARADYQAAYDAYPSPKILVNLGETHRALGRFAQAVLQYEKFLRDASQADEMVPQVEARIAELDPKVGRIVFQIGAGDAAITVDGEPVEGTQTVVDPGSHQIMVRLAGHHDFVRSVAVAAGESATVEVQLEELPVAPPPPPSDLAVTRAPPEEPESDSITEKWWFWAGTGAAAIAVIGVVLGVALTTGGDDFVPAGELPRVSTTDWERF